MRDRVSYNLLRRRMWGEGIGLLHLLVRLWLHFANKSQLSGQRYAKSSIPYTVRSTFHAVLVTCMLQTYNYCPSHHHPRLLSAAEV